MGWPEAGTEMSKGQKWAPRDEMIEQRWTVVDDWKYSANRSDKNMSNLWTADERWQHRALLCSPCMPRPRRRGSSRKRCRQIASIGSRESSKYLQLQTVERAENMARILSRHCSKSLWPNASALAYVLPQSKPTEKGFAITDNALVNYRSNF